MTVGQDTTMERFMEMAGYIDAHQQDFPNGEARRSPTRFVWRDPETLPPRPWVYGRHLIRGHVSVTVAPGGVGKSSLTICEGLAMTSGREILGEWTEQNLRVWIYNLEDGRDELDRRILAAMQHHDIRPSEVDGRLFVDSGRERELTTAFQNRDGVQIAKPVIDSLAEEIKSNGIDVLIVDPFVSSHKVSENDNGAIDMVVKEWGRLADQCNCAIELVHHTRKTNGEDATTESGRGATALVFGARSGRVLNAMTENQKSEAGVKEDPATYFSVSRDKANLAPVGSRVWRRMASVELDNGDCVGVVEAWEWPDLFHGVFDAELRKVQHAIYNKGLRYSDQAKEGWVGVTIAEVLDLNPKTHRRRIKKLIDAWLKSGALKKVDLLDAKRNPRPCVEVGEWLPETELPKRC